MFKEKDYLENNPISGIQLVDICVFVVVVVVVELAIVDGQSSEKRGLRSTFFSGKTLQNLLYL